MNLKYSDIENSQFEKYVISMKRIIGVLGISAAMLLTFSCQEQLFTEYDDQSFLSTTSLQTDTWQLMPDYSFETGTTANDYMDFSLVDSTGGRDSGPAYRLEIKNLLSNGDFEDTSYDPWFVYDELTPQIVAAPAASVIDTINPGSDSLAISNETVKFSTDTGFRIAVLLKDSFIQPETYIPYKNYIFNFSYRTASITRMYFEPDWFEAQGEVLDAYGFQASGGEGGSQVDTSLSNINEFAPFDPDLANSKGANIFTAQNLNYDSAAQKGDTFTFATDSSQSGYFDNFRIVRDSQGDFDLRLKLKLTINHRPDLELISGYYRFSVYVKQETISSTNTYHANSVELGIKGFDLLNQSTVDDKKVFYKTQSLHDLYSQSGEIFSGDWSSGWVRLILASDETIQVPNISGEHVMELTISPSNPGSTDAGWNRMTAGSILISEPILEYSPTKWE